MEDTKKERFMQLYMPIHDRFERYCKTRAFGEFYYKDIMQDTLVVAFEKFDSLKSPEAFLHYLFGISTRILANQRKKKRPKYLNDLGHAPVQAIDPGATIEHLLEIKNLYLQLEKLDSISRDCIILFEIAGFSIKEIMSIMNLGESAVKQRLSRGRQKLLGLMREQILQDA